MRVRTLVLAVLAILLSFWQLDRGSLLPYDEGTTAERVREMAASGDLLTPTLYFQPDYNKPPLYYWLSLPLFAWSGSGTEFPIRFWSVVFALACTGVVVAHVRRAGAASGFAETAAVLVVTTPLWINETRQGLLDSGFTLSLLLGLLLLDREAHAKGGLPVRRAVLAGLALAFGALVKTPLTLLVVPAVLAADLLRRRRPDPRGAIIAFGIGASAALGYGGAVLLVHGRGYWNYQGFNYVDRFTRPIWGRDIPPSIYLDAAWEQAPVLLVLFVIALLAGAWRARTELGRVAPALVFFVGWTLLCVLMVNRRSVYLVPLVPLAAITIGALAPRLLPRRGRRVVATAVVLVALAGLSEEYVPRIDGAPHVKSIGLHVAGASRDGDAIATTDETFHHVLAYYADSVVEPLRPDGVGRWATRHRQNAGARGWVMVNTTTLEAAEAALRSELDPLYEVDLALCAGDQALLSITPRGTGGSTAP